MESDAHIPGDFLSPELAHLIEIAPEIFPANRPGNLEICTFCCMSEEREAEILRQPRTAVPTDFLGQWLGAAFSNTDQGRDVFFWLLPSIAAALARGEEVSICGDEITLARGTRSGHPVSTWNDQQQSWFSDFALHLLSARCH